MDSLYDELLRDVGRAGGFTPLTLFRTCVGEDYAGEMMVVGRAVNGWGPSFEASELGSAERRAAIVRRSCEEGGCPMAWVASDWGGDEAYNPARSAFWRVTRRVAGDIGVAGAAWASQLAWTNLYRVAPAAGGNPSERLCDAQFLACGRLLLADLDAHRPKRLLVVTGWNWFNEFVNETAREAGLYVDFREIRRSEENPVRAVGRIGGSLVLVTERPEGTPEDAFVEEVARFYAPGDEQLSRAQQTAFEEVAGYPWDGVTTEGRFQTDCPGGDRTWSMSPWTFSYTLRDGLLFMELDHRMTNNRTCGVDRDGKPVDGALVNSVYPGHF